MQAPFLQGLLRLGKGGSLGPSFPQISCEHNCCLTNKFVLFINFLFRILFYDFRANMFVCLFQFCQSRFSYTAQTDLCCCLIDLYLNFRNVLNNLQSKLLSGELDLQLVTSSTEPLSFCSFQREFSLLSLQLRTSVIDLATLVPFDPSQVCNDSQFTACFLLSSPHNHPYLGSACINKFPPSFVVPL